MENKEFSKIMVTHLNILIIWIYNKSSRIAINGLCDTGLKYSTMIVEVVKNEFFTKTTINS